MKKLYILHGWAYEVTKWDKFLAELKRHKIQAELLKIPGLTAPLNTPWTLGDYVQWLHEQVKNEKQVAILGHSNGGRIALAFALKHPEGVSQLFLVDSAGIKEKNSLKRIKRVGFKLVAKVGKKILPSETAHILYKLARTHDYEVASKIQKETMKNLISVDLEPRLSEIDAPTTIIWGRRDLATPLKDGQLMHRVIKNSSLHIIQTARHSPQFTNPDEVAKIVSENL